MAATTSLRSSGLSVIVACVGAVAFLLQGYDQGLMNGLITLQSFVHTFPQTDTVNTKGDVKEHNSLIQGTTVAIYEVGSAMGALSCYFIGDWLGRRKTILLAGTIIVVGVIIQASPFSLGQLIAARIITGTGVGIFTATVPVWVSECSKAAHRGKLVMLEGGAGIGGVMLVTWIELGLYFVKSDSSTASVAWRFPIALQAIFAIAVLLTILRLPESPRWLAAKDRLSEAESVIARLENEDAESKTVQKSLTIITDALELERTSSGSTNPFAINHTKNLQRTLLAVVLNMFAQMGGLNLITFYSNTVFENILHYKPVTARVIIGGLQTWQFLSACGGVFLIDRFGRRRLLLGGFLGLAIAHSGLAALTLHLNHQTAGAILVFYFLALFVFPIGLFLIPFMYAAEIAPLKVRAKVTAMSGATNWLFNFLLAEVTPVGFDNIGWKYYLVYVCTNAMGFVFVFFFCPETRGRALEEIDEIFANSKGLLEPVKLARTMRSSFVERGSSIDTEDHVREKDGQRVDHVENSYN